MKISNDEFLSRIYDKNIIPIENYKGRHTKILVKDELGIIYSVVPSTLYTNKPSIKTAINKTDAFIKKATNIHGNKYDYSLVNYTNSKTKVKIICPIHGIFEQTAGGHLLGKGCKMCSMELLWNKIQISTEEFIKKAIKIHGKKYDYSKAIYDKAVKKVKIQCQIHGEFEQIAIYHLTGNGCPKCALENSIGFNKTNFIKKALKNKNAFVYIIRCFNKTENFIKIGISSLNLQKRFPNKRKLPYSYEILGEIKGSPDFVWDKEKELHRLYKNYKYKPLIFFEGYTECFTLNCLDMLKQQLFA